MSMTHANRVSRLASAALAAVWAFALVQVVQAQEATPVSSAIETTATPSPTPASDLATPTSMATPELALATKAPTDTPIPSPTPVFVGSVTAIGDSVMLGAARELRRSIASLDVDAKVSRQASAAINLIRARHDSGRMGEIVIVHIGNNGPITTTQFDQLMSPLKDARLVLVVNVRVPRGWETGNNQVIAEGVKRYSNAVLIDWNAYTRAHPGLIGSDGIHLGARSARAYTSLVVNALTSPLTLPEAPQDISP